MATSDRFATLYLRNVPAELVREAKVKAAREGTTLTAVVIDALAQFLRSRRGTDAASEAELRESMKWYEENRSRLLRRYRNQYIAIVDAEVVDHDEDFESLATRVFASMGTKPIFMPRVTEGTERVRVRTPRRRAS